MDASEDTGYKKAEFDQVVAKLDSHGKGQVWVNGVPLKSSVGMKVYCLAGVMTVVELRLLCDYEFSGPAKLVDNPKAEEDVREWVLNGPGIAVYEITPEGIELAEHFIDEEFREIMTSGEDPSEDEVQPLTAEGKARMQAIANRRALKLMKDNGLLDGE